MVDKFLAKIDCLVVEAFDSCCCLGGFKNGLTAVFASNFLLLISLLTAVFTVPSENLNYVGHFLDCLARPYSIIGASTIKLSKAIDEVKGSLESVGGGLQVEVTGGGGVVAAVGEVQI